MEGSKRWNTSVSEEQHHGKVKSWKNHNLGGRVSVTTRDKNHNNMARRVQ